MTEEQPQTTKTSWLTWLLYFGSKDERHHRAADRAGHIAFHMALLITFVDFVIRFPSVALGKPAGLWGLASDFAVIFLAGGYYTLQWVKSGITLRDSARQRRFLFWLCPITGLITFGILLNKSLGEGWLVAGLLASVGGLAAWGLCWILYVWMDKAAARKASSDGAEGTLGE